MKNPLAELAKTAACVMMMMMMMMVQALVIAVRCPPLPLKERVFSLFQIHCSWLV